MYKAKGILLTGGILLVAGIIAFWTHWQGDASATVSWPVSGSTVKFCGSATGGWVLIGLACLAAGLIGLMLSVVVAVFDRTPARTSSKP